MTSKEIVNRIEETINPTSALGLMIGTLFARLELYQKNSYSALRNLQTLQENIGNDVMADITARHIKTLESIEQ